MSNGDAIGSRVGDAIAILFGVIVVNLVLLSEDLNVVDTRHSENRIIVVG